MTAITSASNDIIGPKDLKLYIYFSKNYFQRSDWYIKLTRISDILVNVLHFPMLIYWKQEKLDEPVKKSQSYKISNPLPNTRNTRKKSNP